MGDPGPWHLPPTSPAEGGGEARWHRGRTAAGSTFRTPRLDETGADAVVHDVHEAAIRARRALSLDDVIRAVGATACRLADPDDPAGRRALELLSEELGWPESLSRETLREMARGWAPEALRGILAAELGDPAVLGGWVDAGSPGGRTRRRTASGPHVLLQIQSGNVPGVGVTGVVRGLLVRSGVLVRASREEPGLVAHFARTLSTEEPLLGRCVATTWWPADDDRLPAWRSWVKHAGKVVLYGGEQAVRGVRDLLPASTRLVVYGPRVGVGVVLPDAEPDAAAVALARDVCAYEQRGCVSPRLVFVAGARERRSRFARALYEALGDEVKRHGPPFLTPEEASGIRSVRAEVELGSSPSELDVLGDPGELAWTVVTGEDGELRSDPWPRIVRVYRAGGLREWQARLTVLEGRIQAVGYAGSEGERELARRAAALGVSRVAPFGTVAWPPPDWRHDGRHQLLPLLEWTDWESGGA